MAKLWEKLLWAALCGTALGWAGCRPAAKDQKALPPPATEAPPDVAPEADAASAGDAVDPDAEGVAEALDAGDALQEAEAADAADAQPTKKKKKRVVDIATTYGPPPSME